MTDLDKRAPTAALKSLVADAPKVPDLAQRARAAHRRRQIARTAAVTAGALVLAGAGAAGLSAIRSGPATRTAADGPTQSVPAISHDLSFDDDALHIAPPPHGVPAVDEERAISLFRSTGEPGQTVQNVTIGYGWVTLNPVLAQGWGARPAWFVVFRTGPAWCPAKTSGPAVALPEGRHVFILDSISGTEALSYQEAGSFCAGPQSGPTARPAQQYVSLPWTQVRRDGQELTLRYRDQDCTGGPVTLRSLGTADQPQVAVMVTRPMTAGRCQPGAEHTEQLELGPGTFEPGHFPTGPVIGLNTSLQPDRFDILPIQN